MSANLRRFPQPTQDSTLLDAANAAFVEADYERCGALLALLPDDALRGRAALLRAQLARRANEHGKWYAYASLAASRLEEPAKRLLALILQAGAAKRLGRPQETAQLRDGVERRVAQISTGAAGVGLVVYHLALDAWEDRAYDRARRLIERNLAAGIELAPSLALVGWIEVKLEDFAASIAPFSAALKASHAAQTPERYHQARTIHALGVAASELIDLSLGRRVRREFEAMTWSSGLRVERFNSVMTLRFLALLEGDLDRAWLLSREAIGVAPTPAYRAVAETYAAVASRLIGDRAAHRIQLEQAWALMRKERWGALEVEARGALTSFALEGASAMPAEARKAVTLYGSLKAKSNPLSAVDDDRRIAAFEAGAAARVSEILGRRADAIRHYQASLKIWNALGCSMRSAIVGLDLLRLTGDAAYREPVERALKRAPNAWFAQELERLAGPLATLTKAERAVLPGVLEGKTAKTIAAELGRSHFTVTNHMRNIFAAFEVPSRAALIATCRELRITTAEILAAPPKVRRRSARGRRLQRTRRQG